jgi:hypothetical protein
MCVEDAFFNYLLIAIAIAVAFNWLINFFGLYCHYKETMRIASYSRKENKDKQDPYIKV